MKTDLGPEYLHAEDLLQGNKWTERAYTIKGFIPPNTVKAADGKVIEKLIVEFAEDDKRLVVGKINARLMKCALGTSKTSEMVGKKITVFAAKGDWFGQKNVAVIRVRVPGDGAKPFLQMKQVGSDLTGVTQ